MKKVDAWRELKTNDDFSNHNEILNKKERLDDLDFFSFLDNFEREKVVFAIFVFYDQINKLCPNNKVYKTHLLKFLSILHILTFKNSAKHFFDEDKFKIKKFKNGPVHETFYQNFEKIIDEIKMNNNNNNNNNTLSKGVFKFVLNDKNHLIVYLNAKEDFLVSNVYLSKIEEECIIEACEIVIKKCSLNSDELSKFTHKFNSFKKSEENNETYLDLVNDIVDDNQKNEDIKDGIYFDQSVKATKL